MKTVSPAANEIFSERRKMISPYRRQSSPVRSVVKPSSVRRAIRRLAGSESEGDSGGFSAFSSCILFNEPDQVRKIERFHEVVVRAALTRFLGDVTIAGEDHVRDRPGLVLPFQSAAERGAVHPFDSEIGQDQLRTILLHALEGGGAVGHDLTVAPVALQDERDQAPYLRIIFHDKDHSLVPLLETDSNALAQMSANGAGETPEHVPPRIFPAGH